MQTNTTDRLSRAALTGSVKQAAQAVWLHRWFAAWCAWVLLLVPLLR